MNGMILPTKRLIQPPSSGPKVLVFDIETAPYTVRTWGIWKQNALDIVQEWYMLSFAYAWYDPLKQKISKIDWVGLPADKNWVPYSDSDEYVVGALWWLFDQADIVVGQNHERFDIRKGAERMFIHKMPPYAPFKNVDLKKHYNRRFAGSASLKYMTRKADVALKQSNSGYSLWEGCMAGDKAAWKEMKEYNVADVQATAELYIRMIPWIGQLGQPAHPNMGHYYQVERDELVCPNCANRDREHGGRGFTSRGYYDTPAYRYPKFRCNSCGSYRKAYRSEGGRTNLR